MPEPSLSHKYRSFVASSIFRVAITRALSLVYFVTFYRLIGGEKADLGAIVILSIGLMFTGNFSDFGLYYAFTQWSLREELNFDILCRVVFGSFFMLIVSVSLFSRMILGISLGALCVFSILRILYTSCCLILLCLIDMESVNLMLIQIF